MTSLPLYSFMYMRAFPFLQNTPSNVQCMPVHTHTPNLHLGYDNQSILIRKPAEHLQEMQNSC